MPSVDIPSYAGEQFLIVGSIVLNGALYPTVWTNYVLSFEAKRHAADAVALVKKDNAGLGGVTILGPGAYQVLISSSDTNGFTKAELLTYDVWLLEPDGKDSVVARGTWKVALAA